MDTEGRSGKIPEPMVNEDTTYVVRQSSMADSVNCLLIKVQKEEDFRHKTWRTRREVWREGFMPEDYLRAVF